MFGMLYCVAGMLPYTWGRRGSCGATDRYVWEFVKRDYSGKLGRCVHCRPEAIAKCARDETGTLERIEPGSWPYSLRLLI